MIWDIECRGFLPSDDPSAFLKNSTPDFIGHVILLENLAGMLPCYLSQRCIREELVASLRGIRDIDLLIKSQDEYGLERLMLIFSYFASAYVFATNENPANRLPKEIAIPLKMLGDRLGRKPILSYASYCLTNWKRINPSAPVELGNIQLLQNFRDDDAKKDEDWFILVHVDIEYQAAPAIRAIAQCKQNIFKNLDLAKTTLETVFSSLSKMNKTLARMPENCSPDVYFNRVRPYIFGFDGVVYEGCYDHRPQFFRGETGAQSSIIPAIQTALGVHHSNSMLLEHLSEMRQYMPKQHRNFLTSLENNLGDDLRIAAIRGDLVEIYNECLLQFINFRKQHLQYAVDYIQKKVVNPTGTGGTPFVPWLSLLIKETEEFFI